MLKRFNKFTILCVYRTQMGMKKFVNRIGSRTAFCFESRKRWFTIG